MPPKNKSQLTENEKWLLTHWVTSGAYMEQGNTSLAETKDLKSKILEYEEDLNADAYIRAIA